MKIHLHAFEPFSRANGPGLRAVVWFQGCSLGCPGCFNPATHSAQGGYDSDTFELAGRITALMPRIEGITISGGEPFQQCDALLDLLLHLEASGLSRLVFSGYTMDELSLLPLGPEIVGHIDVLIAGRYDRLLPVRQGLVSSANQQIHCLTNRYAPSEITAVPTRELILKADGAFVASGITPWRR